MDHEVISVDDDLLDPGLLQDPFPYYRELRETRPVHWNERWRGWIVSRYEDVYAGLHDQRLLADTITPYFQTRLTPEERERFALTYEVLNSWPVFVDPPKHTQLRKIFSRSFTPKTVQTMRGIVQSFVTEFLDGWKDKQEVDLISDFGFLVPANVIATIIGAPREDLHRFHKWSWELNELLHGGVGSPQRMDRAQQSIIEFKAYLQGLYEERLKQPRDDMMSWLMEVQRTDGAITADDVVYSCMLILNAGHETTQIMIGNTVTALLESGQWQRLREQPQLVKTAIEECLRFNGPMKGTMRAAAQDMKIGGVDVKQGDRVMLLMAAANRDPAQFPDPDRLDISRNPNPHMAFGHGIHFCLGAPLARLEVEVSLIEMTRRYPNLELAGPVKYEPRILSRAIEAPLSVRLR
ncbi:cytochrome P450 [Caenimonas soli]|uniref:cytochrome P450 n=1 Tax=Caenimonas soli TaxID=2735555 RepID=UPI001552B813|nr:cytochrome P450 [Caenimonas soli]NPC56396.1 cytochrome P450 [Caenimonas soli]